MATRNQGRTPNAFGSFADAPEPDYEAGTIRVGSALYSVGRGAYGAFSAPSMSVLSAAADHVIVSDVFDDCIGIALSTVACRIVGGRMTIYSRSDNILSELI